MSAPEQKTKQKAKTKTKQNKIKRYFKATLKVKNPRRRPLLCPSKGFVLLSSLQLNGHTLGFHPQTQKLGILYNDCKYT